MPWWNMTLPGNQGAVGGSSETGVEAPEAEAEAAEMLRLAMPTASRGKLCSRDLRRRSTLTKILEDAGSLMFFSVMPASASVPMTRRGLPLAMMAFRLLRSSVVDWEKPRMW